MHQRCSIRVLGFLPPDRAEERETGAVRLSATRRVLIRDGRGIMAGLRS